MNTKQTNQLYVTFLGSNDSVMNNSENQMRSQMKVIDSRNSTET